MIPSEPVCGCAWECELEESLRDVLRLVHTNTLAPAQIDSVVRARALLNYLDMMRVEYAR